MTWLAVAFTSLILQICGGMIVSRYALTAVASPLIPAASLGDPQLDVGNGLPPVIVVPTHWPARIRSAACAGHARDVNMNIEMTIRRRLVFIWASTS